MSATLKHTYAPTPVVTRGQPIHIGGDPKNVNILYCVANTVVIRNIKEIIHAELYQEHSTNTAIARYAPSGFYIASADAHGKVRIWDTVNKDHVLKAEYHMLSGRPTDMAWSDDSKRIVIVGEGREKFGSVFLFDSGASVGEISGHSKTIYSCDFKQVRPYRIATGSEDFAVSWFEGPPFKFKHSFKDHSRFVTCVRFSPDGSKMVTVSTDKKGFVFDGKTGEKIAELSSEGGHTLGIYSCAWSPDSKWILTASADKTCKLWDASTYQCVKTFALGKGVEDQQLGCLWQGDDLLSISLSGNINILDQDNPNQPKRIIRGHNKLVTALAYDPVQRKLYSADFGAKVLQWDIDTGDALEFTEGKGHTNQVSAIRIAGDKLITISMDDTLKISSTSSLTWGEGTSLGQQPTALDVARSDSDLVVVAAGDLLMVLRKGNVVWKEKQNYHATSVAISVDGTEVAVGGKDKKIHLYSLDSDKLTHKKELTKHRGEVTSLSYSPDGQYLGSGDQNREVLVWQNGEAKVDGWVFHTARINAVAWSPDSQHLASVSTDGTALVWSVNNPNKRIHIKNAHPGGALVVTWINDNTVVTGGTDCSLKCYTLTY